MSTVLVVGSGGREHALAWKLAQSSSVTRLIVAPGNAGMSREWDSWPVLLSEGRPAFESLAKRARSESVDLAVIGPDNALADGIVDILESYGIPTFGPFAKAAQIEASKAFAKDVMRAAGVPTARYWIANSAEEARKILKSVPWPGWVIKADGLAFGKGVRVCDKLEDALNAVQDLMLLSRSLVIEEKLVGEEISWMALCDGDRCALLEPARDYKTLLDGNRGPNTGGMGAYSPISHIPPSWSKRVRETVFLPTLREMKRRGAPFRGVLYAGLMADLAADRFWVLEFNARFGDPEAQVLLPRIDGDFLPWCQAVARGDLRDLPESVPFKKDAAVYVVAAAQGYPNQPKAGDPISILSEGTSLFFAGVKQQNHVTDSQWVTQGGRVLGALGLGHDLDLARSRAYENLNQVQFEGMQFRQDIGQIP
jgi:phosphoribosylamine--glycine ligase